MSSYEYTQAEIYYNNKKNEKAIKLLNKLADILKLSQPGSPSHILVMKRLYANLVALGKIKDGELNLMNIQELMKSEFAKAQGYYSPENGVNETLGARVDILVHHLAHNQMESTP